MKVLVVEEDVALAKSLARTLQDGGHQTRVVHDGNAAAVRIEEEDIEVVVCDFLLPDIEGTAVVRQMRGRCGRQPAVVIASSAMGAAVRAHVMRAGADEYLQKPIAGSSLLAAVASAVAKRGEIKAPPHPLTNTSAWTGVDLLVASKLLECTGLTFTATAPTGRRAPHCASLFMLDVARDTHFGLGLCCPAEMGAMLGKAIINDPNPSPAGIDELLGELCNNICGGLKSATRNAGFGFTVGLPVIGGPDVDALEETLSPSVRRSFQTEGTFLDVVIGVRSAPVLAVASAKLTEVMILAEDVNNDWGLLIATKGTRLTSAAAERIARHAPKKLVRVCMVAGTEPEVREELR